MMVLSDLEIGVVQKLVADAHGQNPEVCCGPLPVEEIAEFLPDAWCGVVECRERDECIQKLIRLGLMSE